MSYNRLFFPIMLAMSCVRSFHKTTPMIHRMTPIMKMSKKSKNSGENFRSLTPLYSPRSHNQKQYVKYLDDPNVSLLLGVGPAGTGKTLFACSAAAQEMKRGSVQKIILTRPVIPVEEEELGFLPGNLIHKMNPWTRPMFDVLNEFYTQRDIDLMLQSGAIEISPLAYMRGRTFKRAFVIADEMQNSSPGQMIMLTTRLGEGSKMVITGDLKQSDRMTDNGLADFINKLKKYSGNQDSIKMVEMGTQDIERSPLVSRILDIYDFDSRNKIIDVVETKPIENPLVVYNVIDKTVVQEKVEVKLTNTTNIIPQIRKPLKTDDRDCALIPDDPYERRRRG